MLKKSITLACSVMLIGAFAQAEKSGKEAYAASCMSCHGENGAGGKESGTGPNLTILKDDYATKQFKLIRDGKRVGEGSKKMNEFLDKEAKLSAAELEAALKYALELPEAAPNHAKIGNAAAGTASYALCGTCHGQKGEGYVNPAVPAPRLAGQADWYIVDSLKAFKAKHRGSGDPLGMQMQAMSMTVPTDEAAANVAAYIATLKK